MHQYLYRLQVTRLKMLTEGPTKEESATLAAHFEYLKRLVASDVVLMAGRTLNADRRTFGIVIFTAASEADAKEIMQNDPAVTKGVMNAELFPYQIALWSKKGP
jgi:uncharacterized protein YciI